MVSMKFTQIPSLSEDSLNDLKADVRRGGGNDTLNMKLNNYTEFVNRFKAADIARLDVYSDSMTLWEISPAGS